MTDYWVAYRLHGPVQIETKVDLGNAVIKPGTGSPSVSGLLEIIYSASDRDEAEEKADQETEKQANRIVSALSFTFDEGLILGDHYKIREADAPNKSKTDSTLNAGQWELGVGKQVYQNALVKDIVGESEHFPENVSQRFPTRFAVDPAL